MFHLDLHNIFLTLYNCFLLKGEVKMDFNDDGETVVVNKEFKTQPNVVHGNGPSKVYLNNFGNYIAGAFVQDRCITCSENQLTLTVCSYFYLKMLFSIFGSYTLGYKFTNNNNGNIYFESNAICGRIFRWCDIH